MLVEQLKEPGLFVQRALIGGEWVGAASGAVLAVNDPADGSELGTIPACGEAETQAPSLPRKPPFRRGACSRQPSVPPCWSAGTISCCRMPVISP